MGQPNEERSNIKKKNAHLSGLIRFGQPYTETQKLNPIRFALNGLTRPDYVG